MPTSSKPRKNQYKELTSPTEPINGEYIGVLEDNLSTKDPDAHPDAKEPTTRATDMGFLLNVPIPRLPKLAGAPSSIHRPDKRVRRGGSGATEGDLEAKTSSDDASIRPNLAILIRLMLNHPEYTSMLPPKPENRTIYKLIKEFLPDRVREEAPTRGRRAPAGDKRRYFGPLFGRSAISSYKMLPPEDEADGYEVRENSQPVIRLQMLIAERFGKIFRDLYQSYRYRWMPEHERSNARYMPTNYNWLALREQGVLTEWMDPKLREMFNADLKEQWRDWFENCYMVTLEAEAVSRNLTIEEALKSGKWLNKTPVTKDDWSRYPVNQAPILGGGSLLVRFRERLELSSPEMLWLLGLQIKSFFRYRERPEQRIEPAISLLVRHFYNNPDDLALFITRPPTGDQLFRTIQSIDPGFQRRQMGLLFGGGVVAGYNMTQEDAEVPFFAYRLASIFMRFIQFGPAVYWHIREAVEQEVKARGLDAEEFWKSGGWYHDSN